MDINNVKNPILLGGFTSFGSGAVMDKLAKEKFADAEIIDTSGLTLVGIFGIIPRIKDQVVIFQPSLAFYSWIRDLILGCLINIFADSKYVIILCDPNYCNLKKISNFLIKTLVCRGAKSIFVSGNHKFFRDSRVLEKVLRINHLCVSSAINRKKNGKTFYLYANYLTVDKGMDTFLAKVGSGEILGSGDVPIDNGCYKVCRTNNKVEFDSALDNYSKKRPLYCYLSKYDLSPLIIQEVVVRGFVIGVLKNSRAEEILNDQFYKIHYVYLDELKISSFADEYYDLLAAQNIDNFTAYLHEVLDSEDSSQDISVIL